MPARRLQEHCLSPSGEFYRESFCFLCTCYVWKRFTAHRPEDTGMCRVSAAARMCPLDSWFREPILCFGGRACRSPFSSWPKPVRPSFLSKTPVSSQSLHLLSTRWKSSCFPKPMKSASAAALHRVLFRFSNPMVASTYYPLQQPYGCVHVLSASATRWLRPRLIHDAAAPSLEAPAKRFLSTMRQPKHPQSV